MTDQEIFDKIAEIVEMCTPNIKKEDLTMDSVINQDISIDSMNFVLILSKTEAYFGFRIPNEEWQKLSSMREVIDMVKKYAPDEANRQQNVYIPEEKAGKQS